MDSSETRNDMIASNSTDPAPVQDSTNFSYIRGLSPLKPFQQEPVAQSIPGSSYSPQVFTSPVIDPQSQSSLLESEYSNQNGYKSDDIAPDIYSPGSLNTDFSYQVDSHDVGYSSNNSAQGNGGITSESIDKYMEDLFKVFCDDAAHAANSCGKQSDTATPSSKDFAERINYDIMNDEQHNDYVRTELQVSTQLSQLHTHGGDPEVIYNAQDTALHASKVNQEISDMPGCCQIYDGSQQNTVAKICGSMGQSNASSISRSFASESQALESSSAAIYVPPNSVEPENINKPILSMFHAPKFGRSSKAVSKPSGIGLHLNSLLNAFPMGCGSSASAKSADKNYMIAPGKKSSCTTDSRSTENTGSPTSSKPIDGLLKSTEHHSTSRDKREYTKLSSEKKRKRSTGSSDGDGCKRCNCKKTKCLKLYCDCFAAGYYCAETCSCQGCFNSPEYEDTVLDARRQILSRDPLAFAPKILQREGESPASNTQDIDKSTPSSVRHKRGCRCKKSMCLKRYCECYQSNVGCSDGCQCHGCENVYGKKEEYGSSTHTAITEATNDILDISFDQKSDTILHSELSIPNNMTPFTSSFQYPECGQSPEADIALFATHEKPSISTKSSDSHRMIGETCPDFVSSDMQLYDCNSEMVDDFSPLRHGKNSLSMHHIPHSMAVACSMSQTTNDISCQPCSERGTFSSLSSSQLRSSPMTSLVPFGENKLPMVLDTDSRCYDISEDDDIPEILKEHPISSSKVEVKSPNKKRVSPPQVRSNSSITGLRGGRKFILKAVPSLPLLAPCSNVKSTSSPSKPAVSDD